MLSPLEEASAMEEEEAITAAIKLEIKDEGELDSREEITELLLNR